MTISVRRVEYEPFPKLNEAFVTEQMRVNWGDLFWAATNKWLTAKSLAGLADELAGADDELRVAISTALDHDEAALQRIFEREAIIDAATETILRERWMRLAVAWLYQHRESLDDPWAVLEQIWEAFGHPESLNGLIRWMPAPPGEEPGESGMLERWRAYIASE